jgi:hypothetical protein
MESRREDRAFVATLFGVGLLVGSLFGVLLFTLFRRQPGLVGAPPINIWNSFGPGAQMPSMPQVPSVATPQALGDGSYSTSSEPSRLNSFTLHASSTTKLFYVSNNRMWTVQVRTVGPPGSIAYISIDVPGFDGAAVPNYQAIAVPSGTFNEVKLSPGQTLFGAANIDGTVVSVAASER